MAAKNNEQAITMTENQSLEVLIGAFEMTDSMEPGSEIVREWIMSELESRDEAKFWAWIESSQDSPREFFCAEEG